MLARTGLVSGVIAMALMAACRNGAAPEMALRSALERWQSQGPESYSVTLSRSCECTPDMAGPVRVSVRNGVVESRAYTSTGAAVAPAFSDAFPSVDGLFDLIHDAIQQDVARLTVRYHPTLGYPMEIAIDQNAATVDDEVAYTLSNFLHQ